MVDRGQLRRIGDQPSVEDRGRVVVFAAQRVAEGDAATEAPPHGADRAGHVVAGTQEVHGFVQVGDDRVGIGVRLRRQRTVLVGIGSGAALEKVSGQRHIPFFGHGVRDLPDPVHQPVPLVDQDEGGEGALPVGYRQVSPGGLVSRHVVNVLSTGRGCGPEDGGRKRGVRGGSHLDAALHPSGFRHAHGAGGILAAVRGRGAGKEQKEEADTEDVRWLGRG